jgi:hypothetical protein
MAGAAYVVVYGSFHEVCYVRHEVGFCGGSGVEGMDWFGLVAVDHAHDIITLCLWSTSATCFRV